MERKLVTIRKVDEICPIEGADKIEIAKISGWQCVVSKGDFKPGDFGIYFEIDSYLPIEPRYEFLRKSSFKKMPDGTEGFRLKTVRLRKVLSQGLLMPLKAFPEITNPVEGTDVTEMLKIQKYEPPIPVNMRGLVKGPIPSFIRKTDQERIQNLPDFFEKYKNIEFEETEKIDGSSMTVFFNNGEFGVCSRNLQLLPSEGNIYWNIVKIHDIENKVLKLGKNIAIQGEISGPGINGNNYKFKEFNFFVFDVWDIQYQRYLTQNERELLLKDGFQHVPQIRNVKIFEECKDMNSMLAHADGKSIFNDADREGFVYKSTQLIDGQTVSFKVVSNKYLEKHEG